jgi:S-adenosylmethionine hydrolase
MYGALLRAAPGVRILVLTNEVPPHDVLHGAFVLATAAPHFPEGTVHLAVVDPGVGSERRGLVLEAGGQLYVGPDNGLFTEALEADPHHRAWQIDTELLGIDRIDPTFHGRDVFAPVAARLAAGTLAPGSVGPRVSDALQRTLPAPFLERDTLRASILHVDVFGNVITNLRREEWEARIEQGAGRLALSGRPLPLVRSYAEAGEGALVALWGSSGRLELARREARADEVVGRGRGEELVLSL